MSGPRSDRVSLFAAAVGLLAALFPFLIVRPNRIASGIPYHVWAAFLPAETLAYAALLLAAVAIALRAGDRSWGGVALGVAGNLLIVLVVLACAERAAGLRPADGAFARVSLAPGSWLAALSGYLLILASYRRAPGAYRILVGGLAVALLAALASAGALNGLSLVQEYLARRDRFADQLGYHVALSLAATAIATVLGVPLGVWAFRRKSSERSIFLFVNTVQTIPSLALFGLLIAPLAYLAHASPFLRDLGVSGIGTTPAVIALTLYALLPIVRNTHASLRVIDPGAMAAGSGMGMSRAQLLASVQLPLALPVILSGVRTSLVQAIGNTTIAALIGAGGFGVFIFQGLGQGAPDLILLGTIPVILLALAADRAASAIIWIVTPRGVRAAGRDA